MKCPECRKGELEIINFYVANAGGESIGGDDPYYKCTSCKTQFDPEDIEE